MLHLAAARSGRIFAATWCIVAIAISSAPSRAQNAGPRPKAPHPDVESSQSGILAGEMLGAPRVEQAIRAAFERPISIDFKDTPLDNVAAALQKLVHVPIAIDKKELAEASISEDVSVTLVASSISARSAFDLILKPKDLDWIIDRDVVVITTADRAKTAVTIHLYPVADLVMSESEDAYVADFEPLIDLITSTVSPTSWDENGGAGSIAPFTRAGALAIGATREVHEEIDSLLERLREVRDIQGLPEYMNVADSSLQRAEAAQASLANWNAAAAPAPQPQPTAPRANWRMPRVYH